MKRKFDVWLPLLLSIVMIIGMYVGYRFAKGQPNKKIFKTDHTNALQEALDIINRKYVDSVNIDTLEANAINEMMSELDPHSVYLPLTQLKEANDELAGSFEGIGVEFTRIRDTVNITYVVPEGPSDKAGLEIGDQILKVDGKNLIGKDITSSDVKKNIKGEKGTKINLEILRGGRLVSVSVTRGNIASSSVSAQYMMNQTTGYIKLETFTGTSYREFMQALESLQQKGLKQLIFDLRGNGGGYMDQAVDIADEFLSGDKLIVYTQGMHNPKEEYRCKRPGLFETGKLVVLVDELSASASEILAGALQDWGRAKIIGRRTFGKGLVQEPFMLSDGSGMRLTVARYYTPLGRSIQKPYTGGKKVYLDELWERYANGQLFYADSNKIEKGKPFKTTDGRTLYSGGGIMPDIFVGLDTSKYSREINKVFFSGIFNDFVFHYYLDNKNIVAPFQTPLEFAKSFEPSQTMWPQFSNWVKKDSINLSGIPSFEKKKVEDRMEAQLARYKWRDAGFYQILNSTDPIMQKAIEVFNY
ncbi:MAG TPA: S41 family peptidase [Niabella sp.]|nr:S41 family peptidase [Niabella sp.]HOZ98174.1 S41 family peptidase [Niabella sp.]HQW16070.1 S41 family peptidase [Niabella sp.]HQX21282.1 S41 family peptidase [Niabella sp.]HQX41961.1 S41 family peptidase [Niabella sp.]